MKVLIAILTCITAFCTAYTQYLKSEHDKQVKKQYDYEVYVSNYQDEVECKLAKMDSMHCR